MSDGSTRLTTERDALAEVSAELGLPLRLQMRSPRIALASRQAEIVSVRTGLDPAIISSMWRRLSG
jgi:hypothetical protein